MASKRNDKRNRIVFDHHNKFILKFLGLVRDRPDTDLLNLFGRLNFHSLQRDSEDILLESWVIVDDATEEGKFQRSWVMTIVDQLEN